MQKIIEKIGVHWRLLTLLVWTSTTALSLYPFPEDALRQVPGTDKTHHLIAYMALIFPAVFKKARGLPLYLCFFALWGAFIEVAQPYVNRHASWLDWWANVAGIALGVMFGLTCRALTVRSRTRIQPTRISAD